MSAHVDLYCPACEHTFYADEYSEIINPDVFQFCPDCGTELQS